MLFRHEIKIPNGHLSPSLGLLVLRMEAVVGSLDIHPEDRRERGRRLSTSGCGVLGQLLPPSSPGDRRPIAAKNINHSSLLSSLSLSLLLVLFIRLPAGEFILFGPFRLLLPGIQIIPKLKTGESVENPSESRGFPGFVVS